MESTVAYKVGQRVVAETKRPIYINNVPTYFRHGTVDRVEKNGMVQVKLDTGPTIMVAPSKVAPASPRPNHNRSHQSTGCTIHAGWLSAK